MFFDDQFDRDMSKQKVEKQSPNVDSMHVDIIPFGETSPVDTRSIAASHSQVVQPGSHPHINEVIKQSDDLELIPLHDEVPQPGFTKPQSNHSTAHSTAPSSLGDRIQRMRKKSESDLIVKHDYIPFRGRRN